MSDGEKARALLQKLAADGEKEALATVQRAREEAERIARESEARLAAALDRAKDARLAVTAAREGSERLEAVAAARRNALEARRALVERVLGLARAMLAGRTTPQWLAAEVERALSFLPDGPATVQCAPRDLAAVRRLAAARAETTVRADETVLAGVTAAAADGSLTVDATAESRLERMRAELAIGIVAAVEAAP